MWEDLELGFYGGSERLETQIMKKSQLVGGAPLSIRAAPRGGAGLRAIDDVCESQIWALPAAATGDVTGLFWEKDQLLCLFGPDGEKMCWDSSVDPVTPARRRRRRSPAQLFGSTRCTSALPGAAQTSSRAEGGGAKGLRFRAETREGEESEGRW